MGYSYECNGCGGEEDDPSPALMGQLSEPHYVSTPLGGELADAGVDLGDTVTLCPDCVRDLLVHGVLDDG